MDGLSGRVAAHHVRPRPVCARGAAAPHAARDVGEVAVFGWFKKDPKKELRARYEKLMAEAQQLQRSGDIPAFAMKDAEAREVWEQLEALERAPSA